MNLSDHLNFEFCEPHSTSQGMEREADCALITVERQGDSYDNRPSCLRPCRTLSTIRDMSIQACLVGAENNLGPILSPAAAYPGLATVQWITAWLGDQGAIFLDF